MSPLKMKHRTIAIVLIVALLLLLMGWSFGSSAASGSSKAPANNSLEVNESNAQPQGDGDESIDPDLGKFASTIDHESYLRLRGEYFARLRGIEPGLPFNPEMRSAAIQQMDRQEKGRLIESIVNGTLPPPTQTDAAWTPIGPAPLPNGQTSPISPVSGRATAIVIDPTNSNKVYLGTAQGGVWRSLDAGTTWTAIFDSAESLAIGALAIAPSNPTILYVGTGEFNGYLRGDGVACGDCFFGVGLYRIENADTSATLVGPINPRQTIGDLTYNVFSGRSITKVLVSPSDAGTIFVTTARGADGKSFENTFGVIPRLATVGLYRSTNATSAAGSVSFQKLAVSTDNSVDNPSTGNVDATDAVMEPGNPNNLLVAILGRTGTNSGVYRTTNALAGAPTFTQTLALPLGDTQSGIRVNLAINKVGSVVTAYGVTNENPTAPPNCQITSRSGALRKCTDPFGAGAWSDQLTGGKGFCSGQCVYDMAVAVDPNDANVVFVGGQGSSSCGLMAGKSIDGGATFAHQDVGLHADIHGFFIDPLTSPATVYVVCDGGVFKRPETASDTTGWTNLNNAPLNTIQFEGIAVHPIDQFLMIGGSQDNGTEYQQGSRGNWRRTDSGDGGYCLIDQSATDTTNVTMYHASINSFLSAIGFSRITNTNCLAGSLWELRGAAVPTNLAPSLCDGTPRSLPNGLDLVNQVLFYAPMALGPGAPNTLYFGSDRLYRSIDRGDTMQVVSQGSLSNPGTIGSPVSTIGIWPGGDNVRVVGLMNGQVWATSTGSSTLVNITSPAFPLNPTGSMTNRFVGRALVDPNHKNVAYVSFSFYAPAGQGIWKITNLDAAAGASPASPIWIAAGNGIPSIPINALAIDPINSNNIYAGTDIGVYVSTDAGANWTPFGTGLPRSSVFDLQIQPSFRILRAATHGRGIWELPLISPGASTVQFSTASDSVNEGQVSKTITVTRAGDTSFPASVNYATSDTSGANDCNVNNGSASSRCDYIATSGTLNFGANETSKNILIPIVDDAYREGNETFIVTLTAVGGNNSTIGAPASISISINDNELANGTNQIDTSSFFVREHYIDFLNREPDTAGQNFWTNNIDGCTPKPSCTELTRINTSGAFFLSIEFQETGYLVYRFYKAAYGDGTGTSTCCTTPAHQISVPMIRLNEFLPDTQRVGQGVVVNAGNWQQQLEDNKQAFAEEFVQRARFLTAYPLTLTAAQFVDGLNTKAGGALSIPQRDQLVSDLLAGIKTRGQVVRAVAENQTLYNAEFNRAFVLMQYFGYLRRNPNDPQDSDYTGYDFWLAKLNQFGGNFVNAEMVKSFLVSGECRNRFGS